MLKLTFNQKQKELHQEAKIILHNQAFTEAIRVIEEECYQGWLSTGSLDVEAREKFYLSAKLVRKLKQIISSYSSDGDAYKKYIQKNIKMS